MQVVSLVAAKRVFYMRNANMNWSFNTLASLLQRHLKGELKIGDTLIADNFKEDKRKILQKSGDGWLIHYGNITHGTYVPLAESERRITLEGPVL